MNILAQIIRRILWYWNLILWICKGKWSKGANVSVSMRQSSHGGFCSPVRSCLSLFMCIIVWGGSGITDGFICCCSYCRITCLSFICWQRTLRISQHIVTVIQWASVHWAESSHARQSEGLSLKFHVYSIVLSVIGLLTHLQIG